MNTVFPPWERFLQQLPEPPKDNKSGTLNGIANLLRRWDAAIEKQGDYIEGL